MNEISSSQINSMLERMRSVSAQPSVPPAGSEGLAPTQDFNTFMEKSLREVNSAQKHAGHLADRFAQGERVELSEVMVAAQKASVSFEAVNQVRNRFVAAYREIMNMQL